MANRFTVTLRIVVLFGLVLLPLLPADLAAQATLDFRRVEVRWPEVDLVFVTRCNDTVAFPADKADVHVLDNGVPRAVTALRTVGDETVATISGQCPNGGANRVQLAVTLACGTTAASSLTYSPPYDPMAFRTLRIVPGGDILPAGRQGRIPVRLLDAAGGPNMKQYTVRIAIDTTIARPIGVSAPAGTLLEANPPSYSAAPLREITFDFPAPGRANDTGLLFYIDVDVPWRADSACTQLQLLPRGGVEDGMNCTRLAFENVTLCAKPPAPRLVCDGGAGPDTLRWNAAAGTYYPDPYIFKPVLRNVGTDEARTPVFRLQWNPDDLVLRPGFRDTVVGRPSRVPPGATCDAEWRFDVPEKAASSHVTRVTAVVEYPGGETVICARDVVLLRDPFAVLGCSAQAASVAWNDVLNRYVPMPLPLTVAVQNTGDATTDTVFVEALLPDGLAFARGDAAVKTLTPAVLSPFSGGNAEWNLTHGRTEEEKSYEVIIRCWTSAIPATECRATVTIPAAAPGPFAYTLTASGATMFCEGDSVILDGGDSFVSWLWSTGDTVRTLSVTTSGLYWCEVRDAAGRTGRSDTIAVTVWPLPSAPSITRDGDVLRATGAASLRRQWYRDGWPMAGETTDTLRLFDTGSYTLHVFSEQDCESVSKPFDVTVLAVGDVGAATFLLRSWPEPTAGQITIEAVIPPGRHVTLRLTDILGRGELLYDGVPAGGRIVLPLSLSGRAAGIWLLTLSGAGERITRRITRL
ncbi:MAG: hypothetical protein KFF77_05280 [Bacteroidetes bacterium]|nr:hypothetical protein [Bacteroidota bacterium]